MKNSKAYERKPAGRSGGRHRGMFESGKPKAAGKSLKRIFEYIKKDTPLLIVVFFCVLITAISQVAGAYMLRPIINSLVSPEGSLENLFNSCLLMMAVFAAGILTQYTQARIMMNVAQNALARLRDDLFEKLQRLPVRYYDANNHGDIMSRFTNDIDAVGEMLNMTLVQVLSGVLSIIGTFSLMLYTNLWLTMVTVVMIPLMLKAGAMVAKKSRSYYHGQQKALGALNGYVEETIGGLKVVKVFCHEEEAMADFENYNEELKENQIKAQFFGGIMGPVMGNLSQMNYTLTAVVGGLLCVFWGFDFGGLTVFVNYSRQFSRPVNELSMQMNTIFSALAGAERVFAVMDETEEPEDPERNLSIVSSEEGWKWEVTPWPNFYIDKLKDAALKPGVVLEHVDFGYDEDRLILKDISLYAKPGQKIAFVGSTGAGKTTITNLLSRFYDIENGKILIDGVNIRDIRLSELRKSIAMVLQDTHLFSGTIKDNIRYGRLDATDEEIIEAAKTANAHSFIMKLEQGYDTWLEGDGENLSQGQRQLLNIARAAVSKAPILVLDEATSSVDTRTERYIEQGMDSLMQGRTTFVIAHRLSTVRNANAIMVLEDGRIIERGDHKQLLELKGRYYDLCMGRAELD